MRLPTHLLSFNQPFNLLTPAQAKRGVWTLIAGFALLFSATCIWKYWQFGYNALDLAIINNTLWHTIHGNWFGSSIHPPTYLQDHFTPLLAILLPIYALAPRPETLLIAQAAVLGFCAWPIYLIVTHTVRTRRPELAPTLGLIGAAVWLLNPFVQTITLFEFHATPFALPGLLFGIWFYQRKQFWPMIGVICVSLLAQEDVSIAAAGLALFALIERRSLRWWLGLGALCVAYFFASSWIIQLNNPDGYKFAIYYSWLGASLPEMITSVLLRPWLTIDHIVTLNNFIFLIGLLLPFAFLPLLAPRPLLVSFGIFAQLLLGSDSGSGTLLETHYTTLLLPGLVLATLLGGIRLFDAQPFRWRSLEWLHRQPALAALLLGGTVSYTCLALGPLPGIFTNQKTTDTQKLTQLIKTIPADASVAASYSTLASLSSREKVFSINYAFLGKQQFLQRDYQLPPDTQYLLVDAADLVTYQLQYGTNPFYKNQYEIALTTWPNLFSSFSPVQLMGSHILLKNEWEPNRIELLTRVNTTTPPIHEFGVTAKLLAVESTPQGLAVTWQLGETPTAEPILMIERVQGDETVERLRLPMWYGQAPKPNWEAHPGAIATVVYGMHATENTHLRFTLHEVTSGGIDLTQLRSTVTTIDDVRLIGEPFILELPAE